MPTETGSPERQISRGVVAIYKDYTGRGPTHARTVITDFLSTTVVEDSLTKAERKLVELCFAQRRPRDHWRRLRFVVDQARAFVEAEGRSLADFLGWAAMQTDEGAMAVEMDTDSTPWGSTKRT